MPAHRGDPARDRARESQHGVARPVGVHAGARIFARPWVYRYARARLLAADDLYAADIGQSEVRGAPRFLEKPLT